LTAYYSAYEIADVEAAITATIGDRTMLSRAAILCEIEYNPEKYPNVLKYQRGRIKAAIGHVMNQRYERLIKTAGRECRNSVWIIS